MSDKELREYLHKYIDAANNKDIAAIQSFIEDRNGLPGSYTQEELNEFYRRRDNFLNGKSKGYSVEEVHSYIRQMKNSL